MLGGKYSSNTTTTNVHTCYPSEDPNCIKPNNFQAHALSNFDYRDWHTYAVAWNADKIIWYVDNMAIRTLKNANLDNYGNSIIDSIQIILNVAILKDYLPPTSPPFQEYMYVDYVKVHKLKCDKNTVVTQIPNFNTYNYAVKKSISLSSTTTIPQNNKICLRATDFIELKNGFEVPLGAELYLDVTPCESAGIGIGNPGGGISTD